MTMQITAYRNFYSLLTNIKKKKTLKIHKKVTICEIIIVKFTSSLGTLSNSITLFNFCSLDSLNNKMRLIITLKKLSVNAQKL